MRSDIRQLILDASVVINLLATEHAWQILDCQDYRAVVVEQVVAEVKRCPVTRSAFAPNAHPLRISPNVDVIQLDGNELVDFVELAKVVGDGEAASIVVAAARGLPLAMDDKRARREALSRYPSIDLVWTTELLNSPQVQDTFGERVADFFKAARDLANMFTPSDLGDS